MRKQFARWVIAFVPDIRNIPKAVEIKHRKLQAQGIRLFVYDIDFNAEWAKKYGVKKAPTYIVMQISKLGFNGGMFNQSSEFEVRRTEKLADIQKWSTYIKASN